VFAPPVPPEVKVRGGRIQKTPPKKAPKKPVPATKKPRATKAAAAAPAAPAPAKAPRKTGGSTGVKKSVNLKAKELEALQAGCLHDLDARQAKFVDLWLVTQNGTQSYLDAGYECKSDAVAAAAASRLLKKVKDHPYTQAKRAALFANTEAVTGKVIERIYGAAMADPRELVEYVYKCCRCCHGKNFRYQMTPRELEARQERHKQLVAEAKHEKRKPPVFDELGGLGFDANRDPHPECPECNGNGIGQHVLKDTRHLSPGALVLYGGVKETKDGLEMKVYDNRPYLELLGRLYNMNIEPAAPPVALVDKAVLDERLERGRLATQAQREAMAKRLADIAGLGDGGDE
ncbi:terminase small subunit, partial [Pseudomonas sp. TWP3-2]|uniref:terminase small subunit n=1 Tax=Pseudomonas sp. TWP3-2 TaxID=2804574 RepID=UPI003CF2C2FA